MTAPGNGGYITSLSALSGTSGDYPVSPTTVNIGTVTAVQAMLKRLADNNYWNSSVQAWQPGCT